MIVDAPTCQSSRARVRTIVILPRFIAHDVVGVVGGVVHLKLSVEKVLQCGGDVRHNVVVVRDPPKVGYMFLRGTQSMLAYTQVRL